MERHRRVVDVAARNESQQVVLRVQDVIVGKSDVLRLRLGQLRQLLVAAFGVRAFAHHHLAAGLLAEHLQVVLGGLELFGSERVERHVERQQFGVLQQAFGGLDDVSVPPQSRHVNIHTRLVVTPVGIHRMLAAFLRVHLAVRLADGEQGAADVSHRFAGGLEAGRDLSADT